MLSEEELRNIKRKMKYTHTCGADFARALNVTRQAVNLILNRQGSSEKIESFIREWNSTVQIKRLKNDSKDNQ